MEFPVEVTPLGVFLVLLPVGAYLGMELEVWTVYKGIGSVVIGYLLVLLHQESG